MYECVHMCDTYIELRMLFTTVKTYQLKSIYYNYSPADCRLLRPADDLHGISACHLTVCVCVCVCVCVRVCVCLCVRVCV